MTATDTSHLFTHYWSMLAPADVQAAVVWTHEHRFAPPRKWRFDHAAIDRRVAVELDGGNHLVRWSQKEQRYVAVGRHTKPEDYDKLNQAAALGWRVFRFSPQMLTDDPHRCISQVLQALGYAPITED